MLYKYLTEQVMCFHDINIFRPAIAEFCIDMENLRTFQVSRGAGREVWNRVYMIAPVEKFGRVRLSTIYLQNKYGGECRST